MRVVDTVVDRAHRADKESKQAKESERPKEQEKQEERKESLNTTDGVSLAPSQAPPEVQPYNLEEVRSRCLYSLLISSILTGYFETILT